MVYAFGMSRVGKRTRSLGTEKGEVVHIAWYSQSEIVVVWNDGGVELWHVEENESTRVEQIANAGDYAQTVDIRMATLQPGTSKLFLLGAQGIFVRDIEDGSGIHLSSDNRWGDHPITWCEDNIHYLLSLRGQYPVIYNTDIGELVYEPDKESERGSPLIEGCEQQTIVKHREDSRYINSIYRKAGFRFWDMETQTSTFIPFEIDDNLSRQYTYIQTAPFDHTKLFFGSFDHIAVLDLDTNMLEVLTDDFQKYVIEELVWSPTSEYIGVRSTFEVTVMDLEDELLTYPTRVNYLYWFSDTQLHAVESHQITEIDVTTSAITTFHKFRPNIPPSGYVTYIANENKVLLGTGDFEIYELDLITKEASLLITFEKPWEDARFGVISASPDGEKVFVEGAARMMIWNRDFTEILFETGRDHGSNEVSATWSADSEVVWFVPEGELTKIDLTNGQAEQYCVQPIATMPEWARCREISVNNQEQVATLYYDFEGSYEGAVVVHNGISDDATMTLIEIPHNSPQNLKWSPDREFLAVSDLGGFVILIPRSEIEARLAEDVTSE